MLSKVSIQASSISTVDDQQVDKQVSDCGELETLNQVDKAILTINGDLQYHVDHSTKVTVQNKTPQGDFGDGSPTCDERMMGTPYIGDLIARKSLIVDLLETHKTYHRDGERQTSAEEFKTLQRDDKKHLSRCGGGKKTS